jgi:hypothetical protein
MAFTFSGMPSGRLVVRRTPQPAGRCLARRHDLFRVLIAQLVKRERAAFGNGLRLQQQFGGVDAREPVQRPQIALGVRRQFVSALSQRRLYANRGQHVVQPLAASRMHLHVAGGGQRQSCRIAD